MIINLETSDSLVLNLSYVHGPQNGFVIQYNPETKKIHKIRKYDKKGYAVLDIDYDHNHRNMGNPHAHDFDKYWKKGIDPRHKGRKLTDEERKLLEVFEKKYKYADGYLKLDADGNVVGKIVDDELLTYDESHDYIVVKTTNNIFKLEGITDAHLNNYQLHDKISDINIKSKDKLIYKEKKNSTSVHSNGNNIKVTLKSFKKMSLSVECKKLTIVNRKQIKEKK